MYSLSFKHAVWLKFIFAKLNPEDKTRWVTNVVMGLPIESSPLWNPSESYDDSQKVVKRLYNLKQERRFVKALRLCNSPGLLNFSAKQQMPDNINTDTFSINQVTELLAASPSTICSAALLSFCKTTKDVLNLIEAFAPAQSIRSDNQPLFQDMDT